MKTAVLWWKACSVFRPDFHVEYLPDNPWIHQPFEVYDTLRPQELGARLDAGRRRTRHRGEKRKRPRKRASGEACCVVVPVGVVPRRGLEPPRCYPPVPETGASTNSAIWATRNTEPIILQGLANVVKEEPPPPRRARDACSPRSPRRACRSRRDELAERLGIARRSRASLDAAIATLARRGEILVNRKGAALHRREARPRRRAPSRAIRTASASSCPTTAATTSLCPRARCTRRCTATAPACASPASTGAGGPRARSSRCSSARTARSSAAFTRSAASGSSSPRTAASTRT